MTCVIGGCEQPHRARGWCTTHYARWQRTGDPLGHRAIGGNVCEVDGCDQATGSNAMCIMHLKRYNRTGTTARLCNQCGTPGGADEFGVDRAHQDGLADTCRKCIRSRARAARDATRATHLPGEKYTGRPCRTCRSTLRYCSNGGCVACVLRKSTERMAAGWRPKASPASRAASCRRYAETHRVKLAGRERARTARKRSQFVERVDRFRLWLLGAGCCGICGQHVDVETMHVDHIVPIARGGEHSYTNTQAAHPSCNRVKGVRTNFHIPPRLPPG